jgi:polyhydroxyalkanoate synthesis regulator phasin
MTTVLTPGSRAIEQIRNAYSVDQQVKYLHLQAEIEVLLQQLQTLKQKNQRDPIVN